MKNKVLFLIIILGVAVFGTNVKSAGLKDAFDPSTLGVVADKAGYTLSNTDTMGMVSNVISVALSMLGVIFLVLLIYGGFLWMTARGNEQQVEKAKEVMYSAIIGLVIVLAAYTISYFVVNSLTKGVLKEV